MMLSLISQAHASPAMSYITPLDERNPAYGAPWTKPNIYAPTNRNEEYWLESLENLYNTNFERNVDKIPKSANLKTTPWPGPYWPTYQDGINHRWEGGRSDSPVEKYAKAFNLDPKRLADQISAINGIDNHKGSQPPCNSNQDCDSAFCAIRSGESSGVCIPSWWGLCHAWAPAAILEKEPKCAITRNGVTFEPLDLKALITGLYDSGNIGTVFTGQRCDDNSPKTDGYGRYASDACRDVSPHFFHIAVSNLLDRGHSFVVDVSTRADVWNQPVSGFQVESIQDITPEEATSKYFSSAGTKYPFNERVKSMVEVTTRFSYVLESNENASGLASRYTTSKRYSYLLELDQNRNIIGGEWIKSSKGDHIDFLWVPTNTPSSRATLGGIQYSNVKQMLEESANSAC